MPPAGDARGRPDGLPDIDWVEMQPQDAEGQGTAPGAIGQARFIARYPVTNAHYRAFTSADDYAGARWWREGYQAPEPAVPQWDQPNRPRIEVAWVEAPAFCRWLTARYRSLIPEHGRPLPQAADLAVHAARRSARLWRSRTGRRPCLRCERLP
jgi:hypothetical protein